MTDNPPHVHIRPATTADAVRLEQFIAPFVEANRLLPRTTEELAELVHDGFIAEMDSRIVGFAALEVYSSKLAEVRSLAVDPVCRRQGVGQRLVSACIDRARGMKILEVMAITSSEEFFRRCGFDFTLPGEKKALFISTDESTSAAEESDEQ